MAIRPNNKGNFVFSVFVLLAVTFLLSVQGHAQVAGATVTGTVTDPSGAVIPNAEVSTTNTATGITTNVKTNSAGFYATPNLIPGPYQVTIRAEGFQIEIRSGITLTVGGQQVLNVALPVGKTSQTIEVNGEAATIELSSSAISETVAETEIRELSLNGRDWTLLAALQPGVGALTELQQPVSTRKRAIRGNGAQLTVSGWRPQQNNYRVDGINVNDYANNGPGDAFGTATGVDAIQEFSVVTSNYSAEYGRTSGGVINAITRMGTNQLHGTAYEFLRNSALDARNYFDGPQIPPFRRNQFGVSVGAPIIKDKTFIFVDYEGLRQPLGSTVRANVPSPDARNGIIHNADGTTTTIQVDPNVVPFLAIYAPPNAGLSGLGNTGIYSFVARQLGTSNFETVRIDHHFSKEDSFFGTYLHDSSDVTQPDALDTVVVQEHAANQRLALEETHIFSPKLVNALRFGLNRIHNNAGGGLSAINPAASDPALGAIPGADAPRVFVSGLTTYTFGLNDQMHSTFPWTSLQAYDDANLTIGKHSIKFGGGVERDRDNEDASADSGDFRFGSLTALLQNQTSSFTYGNDATRHFRETIFGAYIQDDIRWRPNLTINLGLRYEMSRVPTETHNELANLYNVTDATLHLGNPLFNNPTLRNFEPRVGFAWDPFGDGKTSIRSGFGMFDVLPLLYEFSAHGRAAPFTLSASSSNSSALMGTFPAGALAVTNADPLQETQSMGQNPKRNYVMQWNLSVQREVKSGLTVMATYLGSRGVHNPFTADDMNMVLPALTSAGYLWPNPATNPTVLNPNWGDINALRWDGSSFYDALEALVTKRLSHGFQIEGSYTFGKSIDTGSASGAGDPFLNSVSNLFFFESNRGLSDFNVKHNLVINTIWTAPTPHMGNRVADWVLGGWELGAIFEAKTGLPFTVLIGGDPLGTLDSSPVDFPTRLGSSGCASAVNPGNVNNYINLSCFGLPMSTPAIAAQCVPFTAATVTGTCQNLEGNVGRNSTIGPGLVNLDFSVFKNNYFGHSERFNVQFRTEFFNILNHPNFNAPIDNETLFDQTGAPVGGAGAIDSTSTNSRQIQFALKLIW